MKIEVEEVSAKEAFRFGMVGLVGETNAGKSTLLNAILGRKVAIISARPQTTRRRIMAVKHAADYQLVFIDTPGFLRNPPSSELSRALEREASESLKEVDVLLLVLDAEKAVRKAEEISKLREMLSKHSIAGPQFIALNKIDLVQKELLLPLLAECNRQFYQSINPPEFIPLSALSGDGVALLERELVKRLPLAEAMFPADFSSDQSEEMIVSELIREKCFQQLRQEVPQSLAIILEGLTEEEKMVRVHASVVIERESQKAIVIGRGGSMLKSIGQAAREELELLWGMKVFLGLHVKVDKDWTQNRSLVSQWR